LNYYLFVTELLGTQGVEGIGRDSKELTVSPSILFGAVGKTATHSENLKQKTQTALEALIQAIQSEPYEPEVECCPYCQSKEIVNRSFRPKTVKTVGNLSLALSIRRKKCKNCRRTCSPTEELTLPNGRYDRGIVELAGIMYFGGCSYDYVRDVLHSTLGVAPWKRAIQNWVMKLGLKAKRTNQSVLTRKTAKRFAADEQYFTLRIPGADGTACVTVCIDLETNKIVDFRVNDAKQLNYLLASDIIEPMDKAAELIVTDGAPAYASAIQDKLPNAEHQLYLQHRVRNKRKKKEVKKQFKHFKKELEAEERAKFKAHKAKLVKVHKKKFGGLNERRREEGIQNILPKKLKKNKKGSRRKSSEQKCNSRSS